jgi:hypothetical protein
MAKKSESTGIFGFCSSGKHARVVNGEREGCPGSYKRFFIGTAGKDKNKIVHTDEIVTCDCPCHKKEK